MAIKIQIASLEALERLIGGDSEVEIEIRESIVQNFSKKHLKGVAEAQNFKEAESAVKNFMTDHFLKKDSFTREFRFNPEILDQFRERLISHGESFLHQKIEEALKKLGSQQTLEKHVNDCVNRIVNDIESQITSGRINELVNQRLKERLGLS